jgi:hypothetical protein
MFGSTYYHGVIRKYIITFGAMFSDIDVQRFNSSNERIQTLRVPIAYGPKEKFLVRLSQDPNFDQEVAVSLPRMSFELTNMSYNPTRKLPSTLRDYRTPSTSDPNKVSSLYTPVPYDFNIALSVFVKNADDGVQILEQIIPFFAPEWTNSLKLVSGIDMSVDVPTVLNDITTEDTYEGDFATRRALIHTLNFTMKGYIFGPTRTTGVIKRATINTGIDTGNDITNSTVTIDPGLTANGTPTSVSSNSVDRSQIDENDDYGFIEDIDFSTSGN